MSKNLVIVESPAKAKTIEGYLGKDFIVKSSFGHIRDLPKGNKAIDIENNFTPKYEISDDKKKVIADLKKAMKGIDMGRGYRVKLLFPPKGAKVFQF